MNIAYYWEKWSYTHLASLNILKKLDLFNKLDLDENNFLQEPEFNWLWESVSNNTFIIFPFENSYAWNVHQNIYNFMKYWYEIYAEYTMNIDHCLMSTWDNINDIEVVYSHFQSLLQCSNFIKKNNFKEIDAWDNGLAAQKIAKLKNNKLWAIASSIAAEINWLNILKEWIQNKKWNRTKFFVVWNKNNTKLKKYITNNKDLKNNKNSITLLFSEKDDTPKFLYNCIWAFSKRNINLTKIESIPSYKKAFSYYFWITIDWDLKDKNIQEALKELKKYTKDIIILWNYKEIII